MLPVAHFRQLVYKDKKRTKSIKILLKILFLRYVYPDPVHSNVINSNNIADIKTLIDPTLFF